MLTVTTGRARGPRGCATGTWQGEAKHDAKRLAVHGSALSPPLAEIHISSETVQCYRLLEGGSALGFDWQVRTHPLGYRQNIRKLPVKLAAKATWWDAASAHELASFTRVCVQR